MSKTKVAELKNNLSKYLREVRNGGEVIVYDRETAIARIIPIQKSKDNLIVHEAKGNFWSVWKNIKPIVIEGFDPLEALRETRRDRYEDLFR